jgi:NAD(P)H-hydrate epimerase
VAARHLRAWGCVVEAVVIGAEERLRGAVVEQLRAARGAGVPVTVTEDVAPLAAAAAARLVVDALLGTGLRSAPRPPDDAAIAALDGARVLSVDVPSGLDASTGEAHRPCVRAAVTCTLTAVKTGLWAASGREHAGRIVVADIGMPATAWSACGLRPPLAVRGGALLAVPTDARTPPQPF